jgi:hypothetical protein
MWKFRLKPPLSSLFGNICFKFSLFFLCRAYPLKEGDICGALIVEELAVGPREAGFHGLPVLRAQTTEVLAENGKKNPELADSFHVLFADTEKYKQNPAKNSRVNVEKMPKGNAVTVCNMW